MESNHLDYTLIERRIASGDRLDIVKPLKIQIDPEGSCNHNCLFCNYRNVGWEDVEYRNDSWFDGTHEKVVPGKSGLSWPVMERLIESVRYLAIPEVELTGGGEPTIYPYIKETLRGLGETSTRISFVTNGSKLASIVDDIPNNLDWIRVSLDAAQAETHKQIHRAGGYARILQTMADIKAAIPRMAVYVSFCIVPENAAEIVAATEKYKALGFDGIKFNAIYSPEGDGWLAEDAVPAIREATQTAESFADDTFKVKNSFWKIDKYAENTEFGVCHFGRFMVAVGYNGLVYPCCIVKNRAGYHYGDLNDEPLEDMLEKKARVYTGPTCPPCWSRDHNTKIKELLNNAG